MNETNKVKCFAPLLMNGLLTEQADGSFDLSPVDPNFWLTSCHPFNYEPEHKLSRVMADFLCHLSDGDMFKVNIMRP